MTKKQSKRKTWNVGDVLEKGQLRIIISKIEEKSITYMHGWLVFNTKWVFPKDLMLKDGWEKIDSINNFSPTNLKKSKYFHIQNGVCV